MNADYMFYPVECCSFGSTLLSTLLARISLQRFQWSNILFSLQLGCILSLINPQAYIVQVMCEYWCLLHS